jgi:uncharacterized protein
MSTVVPDSKSKPHVSRRDFLKIFKVASLDIVLFSIGMGMYTRNIEPGWLDLTHVKLTLPRLPKSFSGLRIVQLSDLHIGGWVNEARLRHTIQVVADQSPDLVVITGDFVLADNEVTKEHIQSEMEMLGRVLPTLTGRFPTLGILGNHDVRWGTSTVVQVMRQGGVVDLINTVHSLQRNGESLHFAGVDDIMEGYPRLEDVLAQIPAEGCAILLAHEPDYADTTSATGRFDLQLSGHSHGGQVILPFIGPPVLPHLGRKYPLGLYQVGAMYQYTNRGLGMTPPSIRFNCRPEVTVFTLESA